MWERDICCISYFSCHSTTILVIAATFFSNLRYKFSHITVQPFAVFWRIEVNLTQKSIGDYFRTPLLNTSSDYLLGKEEIAFKMFVFDEIYIYILYKTMEIQY